MAGMNVRYAPGIPRTMRPRRRLASSRIRFLSKRSTKTPANRPTKRVGMAVTISTAPTAKAESVISKMRIAAARSVSDSPIVDTS